jgi:phage terminase large subunit
MPRIISIPNGFMPRPYQEAAMRYFDSGGKRAIVVWHRRGGKDLTALHQTCKMMHQRTGAYWHVFPTAEQGRKAIWEGFTKDGKRILEQVFPREIRKSPREFLPKAEMVVELKCGSIWRLLGSDKMEVVGAGPVGVVFSEFALARPKTWDLIRPMLRENEGWMWAITTPRGKNHAHALYEMARKDPQWFADVKTLWDTRAYNPEETMAEERASGMPEALIRQEYECDWTAANVGSYYGELLEALEKRGALAAFEHGRDGVFTAWDLGHDDNTAIWWFRPNDRRSGVDFLDHYSSSGKPMSHYFDVVDQRAKDYGWKYAKHWLPHDAKATTLQAGTSILNMCLDKWGSDKAAIVPSLSVQDGIQALRWVLQQETRFHPRCSETQDAEDMDGVACLKHYHRKWDDDRKMFLPNPVHDWSSHTADAARYAAVVVRASENLTAQKPPEPTKPLAVPVNNSFALNDLWDTAPRTGGGRIR